MGMVGKLRKREQWPGRFCLSVAAVLAVSVGLILPRPVLAQGEAYPTNTSGRLYRPSSAGGRLLQTEQAVVLPHLKAATALDLNYTRRPFRLRTPDGQALFPIDTAVRGDFLASVGLWNDFELTVAVPFVGYQTGSRPPGGAPPTTLGFANPRLGAKWRPPVKNSKSWMFAIAASVALPFSSPGTLIGDDGVTYDVRGIAEYRKGPLGFVGHVGSRILPSPVIYGDPMPHLLTFGLGTSAHIWRSLYAMAEVYGGTPLSGAFAKKSDSPVEGLAGFGAQVGHMTFGFAGGLGLVAGAGSPAFRGLLTTGWSSVATDADMDGIADARDRCPSRSEDLDDFEDADGCPDPDNDGDMLVDTGDACPLDPEDVDGFEDADGCPDPDNDGDAVVDVEDKCPLDPETANGFEDEDGCPDEAPVVDTDADGIPDADDACVDQPETDYGPADPEAGGKPDGCPDEAVVSDSDSDGIPDARDDCPKSPYPHSPDGCPPPPPPAQELAHEQEDKGNGPSLVYEAGQLRPMKPIFFESDRSRVMHRSFKTLDKVAGVLLANPEINLCVIEGHTDATGPESWNERLSRRRAHVVFRQLVSRGVDPGRLQAIGTADTNPLADNATNGGRAKNRRVAFYLEVPDGHELRGPVRTVRKARPTTSVTDATQAAEAGTKPNEDVARTKTKQKTKSALEILKMRMRQSSREPMSQKKKRRRPCPNPEKERRNHHVPANRSKRSVRTEHLAKEQQN